MHCCRIRVNVVRVYICDISDIQKLGEKASILELKPFGSGFMIINKNGCPFLKGDGCSLEMKERFFDCLMYPLGIKENGEYFLNDKCDYVSNFKGVWERITKVWADIELESWSEEDKKSYKSYNQQYLK